MSHTGVLTTVVLFIFQQHSVQTAHIVFLHTVSSYSHRVPQWPLILQLIEKGHNVTFISGYAGGPEMSHPSVTDLMIPELNSVMDFVLSKFDINFRIYGIQPPAILTLEPLCYAGCSAIHRSQVFKTWLESTNTIDLIFSDTNPECGYGLAAKFGAKHAIFQTVPLFIKYYEALGLPMDTSSIPGWEVMQRKPPIPFLARVAAAVLPAIWRLNQIAFYNFLYLSLFTETLGLGEKDAPLPALYDMEASTSLVFLNGNYLEDYPRSHSPNVVKLPGIHIRDTTNETIEPELDTIISSNDTIGFIYISFGTVANAPSLPEFFRNIFFQSMTEFPEVKFLWRWKGPKPDNYPQNLVLLPWVNQQKLLGHPKIKGFITQAGRPSIQEAFYNSVPTIAFPILADQDFNAYRYEDLGTCVYMDIASVTQPQLIAVINRTLTDKAWRHRVESMASLGKDVPQSSVKTALWWTEFILRHTPEEISLLTPLSQKLYWFQKRDLDVWAFLACCSAGILFVSKRLGSFLLNKMSSATTSIKSKPE